MTDLVRLAEDILIMETAWQPVLLRDIMISKVIPGGKTNKEGFLSAMFAFNHVQVNSLLICFISKRFFSWVFTGW